MKIVVIDDGNVIQTLRREALGSATSEFVLRDLLYDHPEILPLAELDASFGQVVPIGRELNVPGVGRIDAAFIDQAGRLVVVECKLWRNPEARREVVGQILDYARALARWTYEDLQREVSRALKKSGNALFDVAKAAFPDLEEAAFADDVARNLKAGRFLLLVAGDGIQEGTERIGEYLRTQPGLAFGFGLVEMATYAWHDPATGVMRKLLQPRVLARTQVIDRHVIRWDGVDARIEETELVDTADLSHPPQTSGPAAAFRAQSRAFFDRFVQELRLDDPAQPAPRHGATGWMRASLPEGNALTIYRSKTSETVGVFFKAKRLGRLWDEREAIDAEFKAAALPEPEWSPDGDGESISVIYPCPLPWLNSDEDQQRSVLAATTNQFVNSLRPRLQLLQ
jgi:hypothetical protein